MDKYEYKVRADEIKSLIEQGEYAEAVKIADTIDWRRVKSVMMLCTISDLYKINRRYEDSRDILLLAYERHQGGRMIVYSLCELSIKLEEYVQAIEYYKEFVQLAPKDSGRFVLQYKLYEAQEVSLEERIAVLEEFKRRDPREKWTYELAYLYHRVGLASKCVEECDEMFLWFGDGRYVLKALELKMLHQPLTEEQQEKYEQIKNTGGILEPEIVSERNAIQKEAKKETEEEDDEEFSRAQNLLTDPTQEIPAKDVDDIQVKPVDVSQYNTINLQRELAESMKEFLENNPTVEIPSTEVQEEESPDTGDIQQPEEDSTQEEVVEEIEQENEETPIQEVSPKVVPIRQDTDEMQLISDETLQQEEELVKEEVFFGNTTEVNIEEVVSELAERNAEEPKMPAYVAKQPEETGHLQPEKNPAISLTAPKPLSTAAMSNTGIIKTFHKPSNYDNILSQEYDGQISLVVPEQEKVEKQITGQLSIQDILNEWEKVKKENERKRMEEIKERVHKQTDMLFADFDESTKSGLLEELEKAMVTAALKEERRKNDSKAVKVSNIENESETDAVVKADLPVEEGPESEEGLEILETLETTETAETAETPETPETIETTEIEEIVVEDLAESAEEVPASEEEDQAATDEEAAEEPETSDSVDGKYDIREMTDNEKEQFAPFIHHKKTRRQIVETIDHISMASYTGNVIITGEEGTGTTALAKLLVKEVQLSDSNFSGKVAKISGSTMNKKDVAATLAKLEGGALIIESAASMKKATVESLKKELLKEDKGLIVLLEDGKAAINEFLKKNESLEPIFNLRVDVEALDDQTLVKYARKYALDQEYAIDELGILALHTRIANMQTSDHEVTLAEIEELVDEAIYYADRKTPGHFFDVLFGKRYDEDDMIVLREKDFMHN